MGKRREGSGTLLSSWTVRGIEGHLFVERMLERRGGGRGCGETVGFGHAGEEVPTAHVRAQKGM